MWNYSEGTCLVVGKIVRNAWQLTHNWYILARLLTSLPPQPMWLLRMVYSVTNMLSKKSAGPFGWRSADKILAYWHNYERVY